MGKKKKKQKKKQTLPEKSNYTRNSIIFLMVCAVLSFIWWIYTDLKYWQSYEIYPAQITDIHRVYRGKFNNMWNVEYQYSVNGKTYKDDEDFFKKSDFGNRNVGDTIYVKVSSSDHDASRLMPRCNKEL